MYTGKATFDTQSHLIEPSNLISKLHVKKGTFILWISMIFPLNIDKKCVKFEFVTCLLPEEN